MQALLTSFRGDLMLFLLSLENRCIFKGSEHSASSTAQIHCEVLSCRGYSLYPSNVSGIYGRGRSFIWYNTTLHLS